MSDVIKSSEGLSFSFGDPEPVLGGRGMLDYIESYVNDRWYEPPLNMHELATSFNSAVHHSSAIHVKRNILLSTMEPTKLLSRQHASRLFKEALSMGNCYLERRESISKKTLSYEPPLAKYMRRGVADLNQYFMVRGYDEVHEFESGAIWHWMEPDLHQEIYGVPEWLSCLHSALLNEAATLFRRKYYANGSHAGYILYMTDAAQSDDDVKAVRTALKNSKGPGNFRNLFVYAPNGKADGLKVLPVSEVAAKDEFLNIKNVTRDDQLAAHRVPWQIMGIPPTVGSNSGDPEVVARVFARNEIQVLQANFLAANEYFGEEIFRFKNYTIEKGDTSALLSS